MRDFIEAYIIFALALALLVYGCASGVFDYKKCDHKEVEAGQPAHEGKTILSE